MALTGQLSDMSLAELIEFFCNQRKTGRLKVDYHRGHGVFFIKEGELVDAKVGQLSGAEAVYFALTLPNAAFDFSPEVLPTRRTISESWTQVVLEGLRRLDEGLSPSESDAFGGWTPSEADLALIMDQVERLGEGASKSDGKSARAAEAAPLSMTVENAGDAGGGKKKLMALAAAACVVLAVVAAAFPFLRGPGKSGARAAAPQASEKSEAHDNAAAAAATTSEVSEPAAVEVTASADDAALAAQREQREREQRWREQRDRERKADEAARKADAAQGANANASAPAPAVAAAAASGPKSVRVQITYDEAGRVTAASVAGASPGAEAYAGTAVRVARGKRFPAGKAGSAVVTIPVN
jgi:Domain of unknown function (DUF4388)